MREKKKSLKLRKFKIARLHATWLTGGTNSNPCHNNTQQSGVTDNGCQTYEHTCPVTCNPDTRTVAMTQPNNPCTCTADSGGGFQNNGSLNNGSENGCLP